jgi:hypothetical protein
MVGETGGIGETGGVVCCAGVRARDWSGVTLFSRREVVLQVDTTKGRDNVAGVANHRCLLGFQMISQFLDR